MGGTGGILGRVEKGEAKIFLPLFLCLGGRRKVKSFIEKVPDEET